MRVLLLITVCLPLLTSDGPRSSVPASPIPSATPSASVAEPLPDADEGDVRVGLWDPRDDVRLHAARRLGIAPALRPENVDWMVEALRDAHPGIRSIAATGLRRVEAQGWPHVVPGLLDACVDPVQEVRWAAVEALTDHFHAWPIEILEAWTRALADPSDDVKAIAANCIESAGPAALDAVPALEAAMDAEPGPFLEWELSDALRAVEGR